MTPAPPRPRTSPPSLSSASSHVRLHCNHSLCTVLEPGQCVRQRDSLPLVAKPHSLLWLRRKAPPPPDPPSSMWLLAPHVSLTPSRQVRAQLHRSAHSCAPVHGTAVQWTPDDRRSCWSSRFNNRGGATFQCVCASTDTRRGAMRRRGRRVVSTVNTLPSAARAGAVWRSEETGNTESRSSAAAC